MDSRAIFLFVVGAIGALAFERELGGKIGALSIGFNVISLPNNLAPAVFLIIFSDLAFNVEILQGTLMTHVLMGKSQREWFMKRLSLFTLFIVIQFFLFAVFAGLGDFIVTWHLFSVVPQSAKHFFEGQNTTFVFLVKGVLIELFKSLALVSLAVFVSTLFPAKLFIGPAISIGGLLIGNKLLGIAFSPTNKGMNEIVTRIFMTNFDKSWWVAIIYIVAFWGLSYVRVGRIKLTNQGV